VRCQLLEEERSLCEFRQKFEIDDYREKNTEFLQFSTIKGRTGVPNISLLKFYFVKRKNVCTFFALTIIKHDILLFYFLSSQRGIMPARNAIVRSQHKQPLLYCRSVAITSRRSITL